MFHKTTKKGEKSNDQHSLIYKYSHGKKNQHGPQAKICDLKQLIQFLKKGFFE